VTSKDYSKSVDTDDYSFMERAVGTIVGAVIYDEFKSEFREAEMRVRIRRHVAMAKAVEEKIEEVCSQ